jgi:hypothetical protein
MRGSRKVSVRRFLAIRGRSPRRGLASLDYVLILAVILPTVAFICRIGPQIIQLAYAMICGLVSWPFM